LSFKKQKPNHKNQITKTKKQFSNRNQTLKGVIPDESVPEIPE
jgi:hypothetical protein